MQLPLERQQDLQTRGVHAVRISQSDSDIALGAWRLGMQQRQQRCLQKFCAVLVQWCAQRNRLGICFHKETIGERTEKG